MTQQTAEQYMRRIQLQVNSLQAKINELNTVSAMLNNAQIVQYLDEDRIIAAVGAIAKIEQPRTAAPAQSGTYHMPNRGLQAQILRYLMSGPATTETLLEVLKSERHAVRQAISNCTHSGLIAPMAGNGMLILTEEGRKRGAWLLAHPQMKCYAPKKETV